MTIKELKKIILEEYRYWMAEQPNGEEDTDAGIPGMPDLPGVDVGADDIDAGTGDDSEETLRQIFDMLKDYFEGSEESTPKAPAKPKADNGGDKDDDKGGEDDKDKKDAKEKIAEIIRRQKRKNLRESKTKRKKRSIVSRGRRKVSNRKPLVERFKKLANIIK